jgi:hypothetical protein
VAGNGNQDSDAANEELRASNEELQSINEEYRSTSEELETSKEELQSMNEELQTVNVELKNKLELISRANSDLQNLLAATDFDTLFLDSSLNCVRKAVEVGRQHSQNESDSRPLLNRKIIPPRLLPLLQALSYESTVLGRFWGVTVTGWRRSATNEGALYH